MDIMIVVIVELVLMLLLTCIQTFFYYKTIGLSPKWRGLRLGMVVLFVTVLLATLELISFNVAGLSWVANFVYVIFLLYPVVFMAGKLKERVLFGIVSLAMFMLSALLTGSVLSPDGLITYSSETSWLAKLLLSCGLVVAIYTILMLLVIHLSLEGRRYMPSKYWTGLIISFSIIVVGLLTVFNLKFSIGDAEKVRRYFTIFSLGFLVIWLLLYFVFYFACRFFSKTTEANMLAYQKDMIERFILQKQASDERIKILSHDLKHSLVNWRGMAEEKGDAVALQSIREYEEQLTASLLINVENESANAMINQKCLEAQQTQVEFQVEGIFYKDLLISKLDICSLLGNLLDNAIEAAAKVEDQALRRVTLSIKRKNNLLILVVENGYAIAPVIENGVFVTGKTDKDLHAIGMLSIQNTAEKYDGTVHNIFENNWFKSTVMLSGYENLLSDKKANLPAQ